MKTAFSFWNKRIAPVFDVARQVLLVEAESGRIIHETEKELPADNPGGKAEGLAGFGVDMLICGAVSRFMHEFITSYGITVIPFISGDLREVIRAWEENRLDETAFAMPGCCARLRRRSDCKESQRRCSLFICPRCGHQRQYRKDVHETAKTCPGCGSTMCKGHE